MGFLERAIRKGVSDAVGKAVGNAVKSAVEPKATEFVNKTAEQFERQTQAAAQQTQQAASSAGQSTSGLEGALSNLQRSMEGYATEAAKNMKICPSCGEGTTAEKNFCPSCGARLPEQTVAQGAVCTSCGKQNTIGTKFCQDCGAKLPSALAEEQAAADKNAAALARWDEVLPGFPKWSCGGIELLYDTSFEAIEFIAVFADGISAQNAVEQYKNILKQNGFHEAGQYRDRDHLYNKINGVCYHVDTEHCFEGGSERASIYFMHDEPTGGYDYVKPEPPKRTSFFDMFK